MNLSSLPDLSDVDLEKATVSATSTSHASTPEHLSNAWSIDIPTPLRIPNPSQQCNQRLDILYPIAEFTATERIFNAWMVNNINLDATACHRLKKKKKRKKKEESEKIEPTSVNTFPNDWILHCNQCNATFSSRTSAFEHLLPPREFLHHST